MSLNLIFGLFGNFAQANCKPEIRNIILAEAIQAKIPAELMIAIANAESNCNPTAINRRTHDYGLMQINERTSTMHGIMVYRLMHIQTNVRLAATTLAYMKRRFGHEPHWYCRYNVGTSANASNWESCHKYVARLAEHGYSISTVANNN